MGFFKFLIKLSILISVIAALVFWYGYELAHPDTADNPDPLVVNDVTGLNPIAVNAVIQPTTTQEIMQAVSSSKGPISIGGARYSMGGQIAYPDSLHLDMRQFNKVIDFKPDQKQIRVQTGITWRDIQQLIDPHQLSIKIKQDFTNFTVGGALSVNAHGRAMGLGPIIHSVKSIQMVLADGQLYEASRDNNSALFYGAIGGYGGLGVITEATLELVDNVPLERRVTQLGFYEFLPFFEDSIVNDPSIVLHNALLYPPGFETVLDISWRATDKPLTHDKKLRLRNEANWWRPVIIDLIARSDFLKRMRQNLIDPMIFGSPEVVWRNWESSYDLKDFGFINSDSATLAMREYFVPLNKFELFVLKLRDTFIRHEVDVLNVSVRYAPKDDSSILAWAREDVFSFMVAYRQGKDDKSLEQVNSWSQELLQGSIDSNGSYYLPFQNHASQEQFLKAYPRFKEFLNLKKRADPENRFKNMMWAKYDKLLDNENKLSSRK